MNIYPITKAGEGLKLLRTGKVKKVYEVDEDSLEFEFTNQISVFDKIIPSDIPFKGETLCRSSAFWFQVLKKDGIRTHFKELVPPNRMRVRKVDVIPDYNKLNCSLTNYLIPLEFISRHYVAGSLFDRIKARRSPSRSSASPGITTSSTERSCRSRFLRLRPSSNRLTALSGWKRPSRSRA